LLWISIRAEDGAVGGVLCDCRPEPPRFSSSTTSRPVKIFLKIDIFPLLFVCREVNASLTIFHMRAQNELCPKGSLALPINPNLLKTAKNCVK
jgi:hypothetical protein